MTLIDLLSLIFAALVAEWGWFLGSHHFGWPGGAVGVVLGGSVGWRASRLPVLLYRISVLRSMRRATTHELRSKLSREEYLVSRAAMEELDRRGEPVESFRSFIVAELESPDAKTRFFGEGNARRWLPELIAESDRDGE